MIEKLRDAAMFTMKRLRAYARNQKSVMSLVPSPNASSITSPAKFPPAKSNQKHRNQSQWKIKPFGLGHKPADIEAIIEERRDVKKMAREAKPLTQHGEVGNGRSRGDNVTSTERGNDSKYTLARLARDRPDILERMKANEFGSVNAAAVEAGFGTGSGSVIM